MTEEPVLAALRMAIRGRQPPAGLVHHTDRGGQYASARYRGLLRRADFRQSMNRADNCYDNAFMESCFGTIKTELEMTEYDHRQTASMKSAITSPTTTPTANTPASATSHPANSN